MSLPKIAYCPSTLASGFNTYSATAQKKVFYGHKVNHVLPFDPPQLDEEVAEKFRQNRKILSISGVQVKQSLRLEKNKLRLTEDGEQGQYILKPIPHRETIGSVDQLPANEHLTMQIASQVYKLKVAENALIFFLNGEPAYLTKRFDVMDSGLKINQEDFATLMGRTRETDGDVFKNEGSYETLARMMKIYIPAYLVEAEKFYSLIIFNYLFSNGDAHLKNFSVQITINGDYISSPAYDLINTRIHIKDDTAMALSDGLFDKGYETESFSQNGFYAYDDFYEFGIKIGMSKTRIEKLLTKFNTHHPKTEELIAASFLNEESKKRYTAYYNDRLKALNYSFSNKGMKSRK